MPKNYYPDKPIVPYKKTSVNMSEVISYLQSLELPKEVKRATYLIARIESANGKSGVNNNYSGCQADSGRWGEPLDSKITGVVIKNENQTGKQRYFAAFADFKGSIDFLVNRVQARGLFVGGDTHKIVKMKVQSPEDLVRAYVIEWISGSAKAVPTSEQVHNFLAIYDQSRIFFK